jgi:hypothetical protein
MLLSLSTITWVHTALSIVALVAGIVVAIGLVRSHAMRSWTLLFLVTAVATSVTGFAFPFDKLLPSHWIGILSLVVLAVSIVARYAFHLAGAWRWIDALAMVIAGYFLVFVGIAQAFSKVPALKALAPTQSEPPFFATQLVALVIYILIAVRAVRASRGGGAIKAHP